MKWNLLLFATALASCNVGERDPGSAPGTGPMDIGTEQVDGDQTHGTDTLPVHPADAVFANKHFKEVTVERIGEDEFQVQGMGRIFEASFSWVVEDGHDELMGGHEMTDAGAPEWGKFKFTIHVRKERPNSTLTLILFENSAQDGSRQHELPMVLY